MKIYAPDYYTEFECIADKCRHSCCIGWEIDVDTDTLEYYKTIPQPFGKRLSDNIAETDETPHFILSADERCPFLNQNGLCDIITTLGKNALCQICADHPRFRNFFGGRIEIGLGLCCEAAGQLILSRSEKVHLAEIGSDGENSKMSAEDESFFAVRENINIIVTDRTAPLTERIKRLTEKYVPNIPKKTPAQWADIYLELERLNTQWGDMLEELKTLPPQYENVFENPQWETPFEQLLSYFIYRHLPDCIYDGNLGARLAFALLSVDIINALCAVHIKKHLSLTLSDVVEFARLYSSEIEYCEENMESCKIK